MQWFSCNRLCRLLICHCYPPPLGDTDSKKSKRRRVCSITTFLRCVETILLLLSLAWYVRDMLDRKTCNCIKKYISVTILIMFSKFHTFSFFIDYQGENDAKKRIFGISRTKLKSSLRFFYMTPVIYLCLQHVSDISGSPQYQ